MRFIAKVKYGHGNTINHEFRCPLDRLKFMEQTSAKDEKATYRLLVKVDECDRGTVDEWYERAEWTPDNPE